MAEAFFTKAPNGALIPQDEEAAQALESFRIGQSVRCTITREVNPKFRRKWWALAKYAFDLWSDTCEPIEYRGQPVQPSFERFRKDLTILAGHYQPVFAANGELRLEAKSLAWSRMNEETFERFYSRTIDAVLGKVLKHVTMSEKQLRDTVDRIVAFT